MKREFLQQEQTGLSPRQRLDAVYAMMALTEFPKKFEDLDEAEREEFQTLRDAAEMTDDDKVQQHYFEQIKNFFIEKFEYDPGLFVDEMLAQFPLQLQRVLQEDEVRDNLAEKIVPDIVQEISSLRALNMSLRQKSPRTKEIEQRIQANMRRLEELISQKEKAVAAHQQKNKKLSLN